MNGVTSHEWDKVIPFDEMWQAFNRVIKPDGAIVLTATEPFASQLRVSNLEAYRYDWIWQKTNATRFLDADKMPLLAHEYILVFGQQLPRYYPQMIAGKPYTAKRAGKVSHIKDKDLERTTTVNNGTRYPRTIITMNMPQDKKQHPTEKPLNLMQYLIKTYTQVGQLVLDPCVGSGTSAVAAASLDRHYICGDITKEYVDIAFKRLTVDDPFQSSFDKDTGFTQRSLFDT